MLKRLLPLSVLLSAPLVFGQLDSNSVTVTANRNVNLQPDQVLFALYVTTPLTASLDDVLAAVKGVGITTTNFSGVGSNATGTFVVGGTGTTPAAPAAQWAFGLPVPFAQMKATVTALTGIQQSILQTNSGFSISFFVQGTQVSASQQQAQTCSLTGLIADATAQAQKLASAAGLNLGTILAMSSSASTPAVNNLVPVAVGFGSLVSSQLTTPQNCALTVKFVLTRF